MGRSERAIVSIGIDIQIKDVLNAMNEDNYKEIRNNIFTDYAFIEDPNGYYTNTYLGIVGGFPPESNESLDIQQLEYEEYKNYLSKWFKSSGDGDGYMDGYESYEEDHPENLYHSTLLVPHFSLVETERWGHSREGTNGSSSSLDMSQLTKLTKEIHDEMKELKINEDKYDIQLIILQHSG